MRISKQMSPFCKTSTIISWDLWKITIEALTSEKDHCKEFWQAMNNYHSVVSRFQVPAATTIPTSTLYLLTPFLIICSSVLSIIVILFDLDMQYRGYQYPISLTQPSKFPQFSLWRVSSSVPDHSTIQNDHSTHSHHHTSTPGLTFLWHKD